MPAPLSPSTSGTIELTVDVQMRDYGATEEHARSGCLRRGSWKVSRHPDCFGEALFRVSVVLVAVAAGILGRRPLIVIVCPVFLAEANAMVPWWPGTTSAGTAPRGFRPPKRR